MPLTPEEARTQANELLAAMYSTVTQWDTALFDQVLLAIAADGQPFSMNDIRQVVPEDACRRAGLYFHALLSHDAFYPEEPALLRKVGEVVSINEKAHGKKVNIHLLTRAGRKFIEERRAARIEQRSAAA
ncbi:hypothetical protein ABT010_13215 [Streptomyces sp. NPDC002668]|uniref:hypothetical protein n=1 Tax=Streptomyces sp. NPDC002668 TaxID=3154422 RepID=UPI0033292B2A